MGNYKHNSDIDICIWGDDIDYTLLNRIKNGFDDLPTPYKYDVVAYDQISNPDFKTHIDENGVDFWSGLKMGDE